MKQILADCLSAIASMYIHFQTILSYFIVSHRQSANICIVSHWMINNTFMIFVCSEFYLELPTDTFPISVTNVCLTTSASDVTISGDACQVGSHSLQFSYFQCLMFSWGVFHFYQIFTNFKVCLLYKRRIKVENSQKSRTWKLMFLSILFA